MIKAQQKPLEEIQAAIGSYQKVLNIGCGGCVSVCLAGGQKEVLLLNEELRLLFREQPQSPRIDGFVIERQCNTRYFLDLDAKVPEYDCLISMACGAGVQLVAERYPDKPVYPAVNTVAIGIDRDIGLYEEKCRACGECVLGYTGGVCPVTRCAKSLFNGPCGGVNNGYCEVNHQVPCAWYQIYKRLKDQNRLEDILKVRPVMEWQNQIQRLVVQKPYEKRYQAEN